MLLSDETAPSVRPWMLAWAAPDGWPTTLAVMRLARLFSLLAAILTAFTLLAPSALAEPPFRLPDQVTDNAGALNIGVRVLRRFLIVTDLGQRKVWLAPRPHA